MLSKIVYLFLGVCISSFCIADNSTGEIFTPDSDYPQVIQSKTVGFALTDQNYSYT